MREEIQTRSWGRMGLHPKAYYQSLCRSGPRHTPPIVREGPCAPAAGASSPFRAGQIHILARAFVLAERPRLAAAYHDAQDDAALLLLVSPTQAAQAVRTSS